jgi:hypothetical protein
MPIIIYKFIDLLIFFLFFDTCVWLRKYQVSKHLFWFIGKYGWFTETTKFDAISNFAAIIFRDDWSLFYNFNDSESFFDVVLW